MGGGGLVTSRAMKFAGYAVDSRNVQKGHLFFALKGARSDGHAHLEEVAKRGALAAVVRRDYAGPEYGLELIRVEDPLRKLQEMGAEKLRVPVIGITGSVGKTTTKEFVAGLLEGWAKVFKTPGNYNGQIGLPLSLLSLRDEEVAVLEMGISGVGEMERLVEMAPPQIAVLTGCHAVHLEFFPSFDALKREKGQIFSRTETQWGVVPGHLQELCTGQKKIVGEEYTHRLEAGVLEVLERGRVVVRTPWTLPGEHNAYNFLMAAVAARLYGAPWSHIQERARALTLPGKRLEIVTKRGVTFINDAYNASRPSMLGALQVLAATPGKRRLAVLGEMTELGTVSPAEHRAVYDVAQQYKLFLLGNNWPKSNVYENKKLLQQDLYCEIREGDVVLVKGSKRWELWTVVEEF